MQRRFAYSKMFYFTFANLVQCTSSFPHTFKVKIVSDVQDSQKMRNSKTSMFSDWMQCQGPLFYHRTSHLIARFKILCFGFRELCNPTRNPPHQCSFSWRTMTAINETAYSLWTLSCLHTACFQLTEKISHFSVSVLFSWIFHCFQKQNKGVRAYNQPA